MSCSTDRSSHQAQVEAVACWAEELRLLAARTAAELSEDGAQPHLIAALSACEATLRFEQQRLTLSVSGAPAEEQQRLTV